ncbi:MAG: PLDc N-terminal domain-containing protein [Bacteroidetes bacterium]|nr:PLDc N-terminal domain-containing protein [Bacteroidota bacterium]
MINKVLPPFIVVSLAIMVAGCEPRLLSMVSSWQNLSLCGLILVVLDIVAILEILRSYRPASGKLIWILFIIFAPFFGLICYYLFANRS